MIDEDYNFNPGDYVMVTGGNSPGMLGKIGKILCIHNDGDISVDVNGLGGFFRPIHLKKIPLLLLIELKGILDKRGINSDMLDKMLDDTFGSEITEPLIKLINEYKD